MEMRTAANGTPPEGRVGMPVEVGSARFGDGSFPVIAGPASIESAEQMLESAQIVARAGAAVLWGGAFQPRTSPYAFQGLGAAGLEMLQQAGAAAGLPTVTEVVHPGDVALVARHVDMLQVGARNMQDFALLKAVGRSDRAVLLKRGPAATVDEWLAAAEYVLSEGNERIVLCEGGIRTFETRTRGTLDVGAVPLVKDLGKFPVVVDPGHASGLRALVAPLALAGRAAGADGLVVEVHPRPEEALSAGARQLDGGAFADLMTRLGIGAVRADIDDVDRQILRLLALRRSQAQEIGRLKSARKMRVRDREREADLVNGLVAAGDALDLEEGFVRELFTVILRASRRAQRERPASGMSGRSPVAARGER
jgi:3-deoxy-7-phosphoheptulonate synthase